MTVAAMSMAVASDQDLFQKIIGSIPRTIEHAANRVGEYPTLSTAQTVFLVLRPDDTGELWVDKAAMCTYSVLKRPGPTHFLPPADTVSP